jgi:hypothetical protein
MSRSSIIITALLFGSLVAAYPAWAGEKESDLVQAQTAPPEASLLDVGILVFDPGLPAHARGLRKLEAMGIFEEVRRSEALYIPVHLERTLQQAGFWGAVRLVPSANIVDVTVSGTILSSNGGELKLKIRAVDSRGKVWLDKRYRGKADASIYLRRESTDEPFQELYNQIANDLLSKRKKLGDKNVQAIDTISRLRFAADLAPVALSAYLETKKKNRYSVARLPARDDPMMARVERLRQRDRMFIDVLDTHYADFYTQMQESYSGWRSQNYWEREALKHSAESSTAGGTSVDIISTRGVLPWEGTGPVCGTPGVFGGFEPKKRSEQVQREAEARKKSHIEELRELGASLASDMTPLLVEVEGKVLQLTGSVEAQYASWRELLREIFATETGLPVISSFETTKS